MGSMISLKVALSDPGRIWKLLLIAPAVNVMYSLFETWYENFDENERQKVDRGEVHYLKNEYGVKQPIRRAFFDNLREEDIDLSKEIPVDCPIKILHGVRDDTVPHQISLDLLSKITSKDIDLVRSCPSIAVYFPNTPCFLSRRSSGRMVNIACLLKRT